MLNYEDKATTFAIRELVETASSAKKPLLIWLGAGVSKWAGLPTWNETASALRRDFARKEPSFDAKEADRLINEGLLPAFFQLCRDCSVERYNRHLNQLFSASKLKPPYFRFIRAVQKLDPLYIVTTNVDELLEKHLPNSQAVQRNDIELCQSLIAGKKSFVAKIHGSISDSSSLVFSAKDYDALKTDAKYLELLRQLLSSSNVLFLGTSLGDDYTLKLLSEAEELHKTFGVGPHFSVRTAKNDTLPESIRQLLYNTPLRKDHRASIQVLEELSTYKPSSELYTQQDARPMRSAHILSDYYPPGTWQNAQHLTLSNGRGVAVGLGFSNEELTNTISTALDDLLVGLICFDEVYCPIEAAPRLFQSLGIDIFRALFSEGALKLLSWEFELAMIFPSPTSLHGGDLANISKQRKSEAGSGETPAKYLRRAFKANPPDSSAAKDFFELLDRAVTEIRAEQEPNVPAITRSLLLRPSVKRMIGMSEATSVTSIPKWMKFPALRLATAIKLGATAEILGASSVKLNYGTEALAGFAFSSSTGFSNVSDIKDYVISGRYNGSAGRVVAQTPSLVLAALKFRSTQQAQRLRNEVHDRILKNSCAEIITCLDGGLSQCISPSILQDASDSFATGLLGGVDERPKPILWNNSEIANTSLSKWKLRSLKELKDAQSHKHAPCPCQSGERLEDCCLPALE